MYDARQASDDAELEDLLREGLGDQGARGGAIGGRIGGGLAGGFGGRHGGRFGARISAALLPTRRHEEAVELPRLSAELAADVLAHHGRVVWARDGRVRGVIGAGALDMNPAVVDVELQPDGATIRAAAKEGLIPQRTAEKAVRKVIDSLQLAYRATPPS